MTPRRAVAPYDWSALLALIRDSFAFMDERIDPVSSVHRLDVAGVAAQARDGDIWVIEDRGAPVACVFLTPRADTLHVGKLAVARGWRRKGLARRLIAAAQARARDLGLESLTLQTRVELVENHAAFGALGFAQVGFTAHPGYDRPTSVTMTKDLR